MDPSGMGSSPVIGALTRRRARKPEITLLWTGYVQKPNQTIVNIIIIIVVTMIKHSSSVTSTSAMHLLALMAAVLCLASTADAQGMFQDWSWALPQGTSQLNYGVAVTNVGDGTGPMEWVVAGFSGSNLVLQYDQRTGKYSNIAEKDPAFAELRDPEGAAIGVCACDIDGDGKEEIYFLNTNNRYSGPKLVRDRLFKWRNNRYEDLFSDEVNSGVSSMYSGRSVACVDRTGSGRYGILLATYAQDNQGKFGLIEMNKDDPANDVQTGHIVLHNVAEQVGIDFSTGGRGIAVGPIIGDDGFSDIYFVNEGNGGLGNRGDNSLFVNDGKGNFANLADQMNLNDGQPGRGVTLADFNNDGKTDIVYGNWMGPHRIQIQDESPSGKPKFFNAASREFARASPIRTVIAADFDNSGTLQVFMNNIVYRYRSVDASNKLYRILPDGATVQVVEEDIGDAVEPMQHGTGAAVADIDQDGVLELLVAHGESKSQGLTFYHVNPSKVEGHNWIRILPLTQNGAPARGAKVTLRLADGTLLSRIIDGGSGYLCEMEPVAHFGLGSSNGIREVKILWPDNHEFTKSLSEADVNKMFTISHSGEMEKIEAASNLVGGSYDTKRGPNVGDSAPSQARSNYNQYRSSNTQDRQRSRYPYRSRSVVGSANARNSSSRRDRTPSSRSRSAASRSWTSQRRTQQGGATVRETRDGRQQYRRTWRNQRTNTNTRSSSGVSSTAGAVGVKDPSRSHLHDNKRERHYGARAEIESRRYRQLQAESERRRQNERRAEMERGRRAKIERRRKVEMERMEPGQERTINAEVERRRKLSMERLRNAEIERRRKLNMERLRNAEIERRRKLNTERLRNAEIERRRKLNTERLKNAEIVRSWDRETERKWKLEMERKRMEMERRRNEMKNVGIERMNEHRSHNRANSETTSDSERRAEQRRGEIERMRKREMEREKRNGISHNVPRWDGERRAEEERRKIEMERRRTEMERERRADLERRKMEEERRKRIEMERKRRADLERRKNTRNSELERRWQSAFITPAPHRRTTLLSRNEEDTRGNKARNSDAERRRIAARRAEENARRAAEEKRRRSSYSSRRANEREMMITQRSNLSAEERRREYWRRITEQQRRESARRAEEERRDSFRRAEIGRNRDRHSDTRERRRTEVLDRRKSQWNTTNRPAARGYEKFEDPRARERYPRHNVRPTHRPRESALDRRSESRRYRPETRWTERDTGRSDRVRPSRYRSSYWSGAKSPAFHGYARSSKTTGHQGTASIHRGAA
ncbi:cartilage acidic protein 1 [Plakobranchus ocellatus]|uniref:Cartilage acidic protein 1 n=1 Tax=Plakobranchus ocellatus TaxID=259542 RepID=A0AAV3YR81_9GAST|nr:cartilage acidic protein 1 [Plakobranchus ocellatus]